MHFGPQLWLTIVTALYLDCISVLTSFGPSFRCTIASKLSASPPDPWLCPVTALGAPPPEPHYKRTGKTRQNAPFHAGYSKFSGEGVQPPSPVLQIINLIFVTIQQDTIVQSLSDYFNVSKFCIKWGNSAWNLVIWLSGKSVNLLPPDVT